jgi:hypothetical protein
MDAAWMLSAARSEQEDRQDDHFRANCAQGSAITDIGDTHQFPNRDAALRPATVSCICSQKRLGISSPPR